MTPSAIRAAAERAVERATANGAGASGAVEDGEYRPANWFNNKIAARLRMAAQKTRKTKRVRTRTIDGVKCYSVADARRWWPADVPNA